MVVGKSNNHDRSDYDLAIHHHRLLLDSVHTKYGSLRQVDTEEHDISQELDSIMVTYMGVP